MRTKSVFTLAALLLTTAGQARADKIGAIGDSISTAMDADDNCNALNTCAGKLKSSWGHSWTTGWLNATSMRKQTWGSYAFGWVAGSDSFTPSSGDDVYAVRAQRNGARWDDANNQANTLVAAGGVNRVTIELGGNDVCRKLEDTLPTKAEIAAQIDATFNTLYSGLPAGATVVVASVPNVLNLYNQMKSRPNFAFTTCQDLWDLNTDNIHMNLVEGGFCNVPFLGSLVCGAINAVGQVVTTFVSPLIDVAINVFNVQFPCGYVLRSASDPTKRAAAQALNIDINNAISEKVAAFNARPDHRVTFKYDGGAVYNYTFTASDVSHLDCFHPSVQGQQNLATKIYNASFYTATATTQDTVAPSVSTSASWSSWWSSSGGNYYMNTSYTTTEVSKAEVYYENCYNTADYCYYPCYLGTLNQQPDSHSYGVGPFSWSAWYYNRWAIDMKLIDRNGNKSPMKWGTCI